MRIDCVTRCAWVVIAVSLAWLAFRPVWLPTPVQAQLGEPHPFYVEPGVSLLRAPDGSRQVYGKVRIDMRNGKIWGSPTQQQDTVYPINNMNATPPRSRPFLLGQFALGDADK